MTETTWEAARAGDLKDGDRVRILHDNGDVIHGTVSNGWIAHVSNANTAARMSEHGYRFERAVPERTLPSVEGIYASAALYATGDYCLYALNGYGWQTDEYGESWVGVNANDLPDDLVRLVPVTEVEEAEKRGRLTAVREAHGWIKGGGWLNIASTFREHYSEAFDGEA